MFPFKFQETLRYLSLIIVISFLSFYWAFSYNFLLDDWYQISGALYYPEMLFRYLDIHPISVLEFFSLAGFLKFNPWYWQFWGYLLRIFDSFALTFFVFAVTNSKKAAIYSAFIFVSFVGGIETSTWASAHSSAIVILPICLGFYFWISSEKQKSIKKYFLSVLFFFLSMLAEPGRAFMVVPLAIIWGLFNLYQHFRSNLLSFILRNSFLVAILILAKSIIQRFFDIRVDISSYLSGFSWQSFLGLFYSLGNFLSGWILIPGFPERIFPRPEVLWFTAIFFLLIFIVLILFIFRKSDKYKILLFLSLWIPLFFLPNWFSQAHIKVGASVVIESRYFAISAIGFAGLFGYLLSNLKGKFGKKILISFIFVNILASAVILKQNWDFRSVDFQNKIWNQIDNDVPKDEKNSIFMFLGTSKVRTEVLDWADTVPFAVRRGIINKEDYPIFTNDKKLIAELVCKKNVSRPSPFGAMIQPDTIPLSHVHAWDLSDGILTGRSEQEREGVKAIAECL